YDAVDPRTGQMTHFNVTPGQDTAFNAWINGGRGAGVPPTGVAPAPPGAPPSPGSAMPYSSAVANTEGLGPNRQGGSAFGIGQFLPQTWTSVMRATHPELANVPDAQLLQMRSDPRYALPAIDAYAQQNWPALQAAGAQPTAANFYLAHW